MTGLGTLTAAGRGLEATEAALRGGRSGLAALSLFAAPEVAGFPVAEAGECPAGSQPRAVRLAAVAIEEALGAADLPTATRPRTALAVATALGGMAETERAVETALAGHTTDDAVWLRHEVGYTTSALADRFRVEAAALTLTTSSAEAIAAATTLLRAGEADAAVAGGVDALCRFALEGFARGGGLDPEGCRPFDRDRAGISLGEGAAFLVLEREADARLRGARPLALLTGVGRAAQPADPERAGRGVEAAVRSALGAAGLEPSAVDYVTAHAAGSPAQDVAEARALRRLFGDDLPPVAATKRVFGHTLGAAAALDVVACVLAIARGFLPGTPGFAEADPEAGLTPLVEARLEAGPAVAISQSRGVAGPSAALCFCHPDGAPAR